MATATSSRRTIAAALGVLGAAAVAACGSSANQAAQSAAKSPGPLAGLRRATVPDAWGRAKLARGGPTLAYPPSWRRVKADPGAVSAALRSRRGRIIGYLNATPQQGDETLADWRTFRPAHNADEGDRNVKLRASATGLRLRGSRGSCVIDDYETSSGQRYRELACIVAGARSTTVVVGAAPPSRWNRSGPVLDRAIESFVS